MTEEKLLKYRIVVAGKPEEFQEKVNLLTEEGYTLHNFNMIAVDGDTPDFYAIMALSNNDYSDVTNLRDVSPELVDDALEAGWEIVSTSLSTKFVRMVRRRKK